MYSLQGSVRIQSRYVRMTPYSAAADGRRSSLVSSLRAAFSHLLGQVLPVDLLAQLVDLGLLVVALAELLLDRLQLLPEEELPLALVDLAGDLRLDLRAELRHLDLAPEDLSDPAQPLLHVGRLEQLLPLLRLQPQRRGDQVRERRRVVDVGGSELELLGQVRRHPDDLRELLLHGSRQRLHLVPSPGRPPARPRPRRSGTARPARGSTSRTRWTPWTRIRSVPSGTLIILWTIATVPTS